MLSHPAVAVSSDPPDPNSVSQMFSYVVGDSQSTLKCAGRTARLLEDQFIVDGWPVGRIYGCESILAQRYRVGRAVVREAARILEARGTARMRRGRHGGLEVALPHAERLYEMLSSYCYLIGVSREHVRSARVVLDRVAAYLATDAAAHLEFVPLLDREIMHDPAVGKNLRRLLMTAAGNPVVTFYSDCLDELGTLQLQEGGAAAHRRKAGTLLKCIDRLVGAISRGDAHAAAAWASACSQRMDEHGGAADQQGSTGETRVAEHRTGGARHAPHRSRAVQIVHNIMTRVGSGQWTDGLFLGNEFELCDRYRVDRGVLRQAIRILEAAETAISQTGRGRGLVARTPGPSSLSRLICCHFAATRIGHHQAFEAFKWLGVEMVALAARHATRESMAPIDAALATLRKRSHNVLQSDLIEIEERQFALAGNPVLNLFLRSAKAFPSWATQGNMRVTGQMLRDFLDCSAEVTAAMAAQNPVAAAAAQEKKFMQLKRGIDTALFRNFRSGSLALSESA